MKKLELSLAVLLVPLDFLMIILGAVSAYYIRFAPATAEIRPIIFTLPFNDYLRLVFFIALGWLIIFALAGLYKINGFKKITDEAYRIILASSTGIMAVIAVFFFSRELFSSRFIILAAWILATFYLIIARTIIRRVQRQLYEHGIGNHQVAIIGDAPLTERIIKIFHLNKKLGFNIVKRFRSFDADAEVELKKLHSLRALDEIIQADPNMSKAEVLKILTFCEENHLTFKFAADLLDTKTLKTSVNMIAGTPIVEVKNTPLEGWGRVAKRFFDVILAIVGIFLFSPVMLITALAIKLESNGPIIYKNERVSKNGYFMLFKFRSMYSEYCVHSERERNQAAIEFEKELIAKQNSKTGPVYKIKNDPRVTKVGRFIRRWSIDELPQFFNVFLGTMSMVGPRPHQPREVAHYQRHHRKVLAIKPGVTGLAQISGRSDLNFEEEVKLDTFYIENWSLLLDIGIILRTPFAVTRQRKVV